MELLLRRPKSRVHCTISPLLVDNEPFHYILEDVIRDVKVPGETAIPAGRYQIVLTYSERFKRVLPLLLDVPNYTGIRIHPGNRDIDTDGCLLPGEWDGIAESVYNSRKIFDVLFYRISGAVSREEEIWIEITNT